MVLRMCFEGGSTEARKLIRWVHGERVYEQRWGKSNPEFKERPSL